MAEDTRSIADPDTVVERRSTRPPEKPSAEGGDAASTLQLTKPLHDEALERNRIGGWVSVTMAVVGVSLLQLSPHRTVAHWLTTAALALFGVHAGWALLQFYRGRHLIRPTPWVGLMSALTVLALTAYVGLLSPAVVPLVILVYFFGLDDDSRRGRIIVGTVMVGYLAITVLTFSGVTPLTQSVVGLNKDFTPGLLGLALGMQLAFAATFQLARFGRRATINAMLQVEKAQAQVRKREALLKEAHAELDNAEAGKIGRFSGERVGPFFVGEILGRGAIGEVYAASHVETSQPAALKVLHPYIAEDPMHIERFFREIRILATLDSPHIVKVLDSGNAVDGSPYFAMELLSGQDLWSILRAQERLTARDTVNLVNQVARGLEEAQEAGVVHRDIKPRNLFLSRQSGHEIWKVLDFGVSKMAEGAQTITHGAAIGTPGYMSPEQAIGDDVDHRSDVFSLALVAYRALTGRPAFQASDSAITLYNIRYAQPTRPGELVELPQDVDDVFAVALAKDRERRFRSATSFAAAFRDATRGELDNLFRESAQQLIALHPWGATHDPHPG